MGITGLLPFLKPASKLTNIRNYSGWTAAVDSYCWLHKGAFSCADKLAKGEATDVYVNYCMKMVNTLLAAGVRPIMVFDGQNLPSKAGTESKRHEQRQRSKRQGKMYLTEGKLKEARECFQRCTEVTSDMALGLIKACRNIGVDCIVAPYEADAQLAYLNKIGVVQIVITEDSDLVLFGCEKIMYKMDVNGNGVVVEKNNIERCFEKNFVFTFDKFRHACIMSGCDYLPSLTGIGLKKAIKFFSKTSNSDLRAVLVKIPVYLNMSSVVVTNDYIEGFIQANNTFLYQLVFDPLKRKLIPLNPYSSQVQPETLNYAGMLISNEMAFQIALGNINLDTLKKCENYDPDIRPVKSKSTSWNFTAKVRSIWDADYVLPNSICVPLVSNKNEKIVSPPPKNVPTAVLEDTNVGTTNHELLLMYSSQVQKLQPAETVSPKDKQISSSLPVVKSNSYFDAKVVPVSCDNTKISICDENKSFENGSGECKPLIQLPKSTSCLKFDDSLSTLNVKRSQSYEDQKKSSNHCGTKCRDLFQRFGYQTDRLTLSPLNHTPFKPTLAEVESQPEGTISQNERLALGGSIDLESFDSLPSSGQAGVNENFLLIEAKHNQIASTSGRGCSQPEFSSVPVKRAKMCKMPGLPRTNSLGDAKRQPSIKEYLAKFEFVKKRKTSL